MYTLTVKTDTACYDAVIGGGLLAGCGSRIAKVHAPCSAVLVSDETVNALYGSAAERSLCDAGFSVARFVFAPGEQSKTLATYTQLLRFMAQRHITRGDIVVALGGGVVGDLAGFAAATYLRGISYVQLPTTLLAMVDSSVGGKTAVDLAEGKNLCGCFWQPSLVLCDTDTLATLPQQVLRDGMAEVVKYAMMGDAALFSLLQQPFEPHAQQIISRCIEMKRDIVAADEFDRGERQKLNLGHTVGHAVELLSGYSVSHGSAVAMGLAAISRAAAKLDFCGAGDAARLQELLLHCGLPVSLPYGTEALLAAALGDKKVCAGSITLAVPTAVGSCRLVKIPTAELAVWLEAGQQP